MKQIEKSKIYIGGKRPVQLSKNWKYDILSKLLDADNKQVLLVDPDSDYVNFNLGENRGEIIFARECYMLKYSDLVVVSLKAGDVLTDYPAIAIARKFNKKIIGLCLDSYFDFKDDFYCDKVCESIEELVTELRKYLVSLSTKFDFFHLIDDSLKFYENNHLFLDSYVNTVLGIRNAR